MPDPARSPDAEVDELELELYSGEREAKENGGYLPIGETTTIGEQEDPRQQRLGRRRDESTDEACCE